GMIWTSLAISPSRHLSLCLSPAPPLSMRRRRLRVTRSTDARGNEAAPPHGLPPSLPPSSPPALPLPLSGAAPRVPDYSPGNDAATAVEETDDASRVLLGSSPSHPLPRSFTGFT